MELIDSCVALVTVLGKKESLQEFELLAYEQACRVIEVTLKDFRETWQNGEELENYKR